MWYLVTAGIGVVLGLGLLIFALRERSAKHHAELVLKDVTQQLENEQNNHRATQEFLTASRQARQRSDDQMEALRFVLEQARTRLLECRDPKVVKSWLDAELSDKL